MAQLKPCKKCEKIIDGQSTGYVEGPLLGKNAGWYVVCEECEYETPIYCSKQSAIDAWNKRS